jgi:hypothetical protein
MEEISRGEKMKEEKDKTAKIAGVLLVFFAITIAIVLLVLTSGSETHITSEGEDRIITALDCTTGSIEGAFFASKTANTVKNRIKVTFKDDKIDKLYYTYEGVYRDNDVAEAEELEFHANYNIYMGDYQESLSPTYLTVKTKMHLNLYADNYNKINNLTAKLFFIDESKVSDFKDYSRDEVENYYKGLGFSCEKQK